MQPVASEPNWAELLSFSVVLIDRLVADGVSDDYSLDRIARNCDYLVKHSDKVSGVALESVQASIAKANTYLS